MPKSPSLLLLFGIDGFDALDEVIFVTYFWQKLLFLDFVDKQKVCCENLVSCDGWKL